MNSALPKCGLWASLREMRVFVLVLALLLNAILPSVAAAQMTTISHPMTSDQMDHAAMGHHEMSTSSQASPLDHEDHRSALHCMSSVCCYQEASTPFALVASEAFLTNKQLTDRGIHLPSVSRATKDRPPQQI